jgi:inner membrane transporter RhtA
MGVAIVTTQVGASFAKEMIWAMPSPLGAVWLRWAFSFVFLAVAALGTSPALKGRVAAKTLGTDGSDSSTASPVQTNKTDKTKAGVGQAPAPTQTLPQVPARADLRIVALYVVALLVMNFSIYEAFARIPVGIAVTIEFLGPLFVAVIGSRSRIDLLWVALAGGGVALLSLHPAQLNWAGVAFSLLAALCWMGHITLGARASLGLGPVTLLAISYAIGTAIISVPMFAGPNGAALGLEVVKLGVVVALTTSALTLPLELFALLRIAPALFSIIQSLAPAAAALFAWIVIGERLGSTDWLAVLLVSVAACGATLLRPHSPVESAT